MHANWCEYRLTRPKDVELHRTGLVKIKMSIRKGCVVGHFWSISGCQKTKLSVVSWLGGCGGRASRLIYASGKCHFLGMVGVAWRGWLGLKEGETCVGKTRYRECRYG